MSTIVPLLNADSLQAQADGSKPVLRRRLIMAGVTLVLIAALAAVPLPARRAHAELQAEVMELELSVQGFHNQDQQLEAWADRLGVEPQDLAERAERWLLKVDPILLRNRLIAVAGPCGLTLSSVNVEEGLVPLGDGEVLQSLRTVLGRAAEESADPWADEGDEGAGGDSSAEAPPPLAPPLTATRYTISGRGPVSGVLLFSGLLRQLPEPLRLLSLDVTLTDGGARFTLVADRLACPLNAELLNGVS